MLVKANSGGAEGVEDSDGAVEFADFVAEAVVARGLVVGFVVLEGVEDDGHGDVVVDVADFAVDVVIAMAEDEFEFAFMAGEEFKTEFDEMGAGLRGVVLQVEVDGVAWCRM
jgi:hypothetical protein